MRALTLWTLALLLMIAAAAWQRRTGPSYPVRGELADAGDARPYELPRSYVNTEGAPIVLPAVRPAGALVWRRYPTAESFRTIPLARRGDALAATLPPQPAAGKVEYYVELYGAADTLRLPAREAAVLRYRGPVRVAVLLPHVLMMFLAMLVAVRAALGALVGRAEPRLAWLALAGFSVGGLVLGPMVQKEAFGAYWTGVPWGWDLTDNKTLVMWVVWLVACLAPLRWPRSRRALLLAAGALTLVVYVIPHSMQGSQLDYGQTPPAASAASEQPAPAAQRAHPPAASAANAQT